MEKGDVLLDASAHVLFEASGDSDGALEEEYSGKAEDDAESVSRYEPVWEIHVGGDEFENLGGMEEEDGGSSEEEEGVVDQCLRGKKVPPAVVKADQMLKKSKVACEESSNVKLMNERERDRLFWEACLAS